jgi:hypothetical protein
MAVDFTTDIGKVRALTGDTDEAAFFLPDTQVSAILTAEGGVTVLAAATCLEVMATNHVNILKKIKLMDLTTDGPSMAKVLLDRAKEMRGAYALTLQEGESDFEIFPVIVNANQRAEYMWHQWQKGIE